jgi:hypothetical protein
MRLFLGPEILPENVLAAPVERLIVPAEKRRIVKVLIQPVRVKPCSQVSN